MAIEPSKYFAREPATQMKSNIVDAVQGYMLSDDTNDSTRIQNSYEEATPDQRAIVDDIFASLCGYSLATIISECGDDEVDEDDEGEDETAGQPS